MFSIFQIVVSKNKSIRACYVLNWKTVYLGVNKTESIIVISFLNTKLEVTHLYQTKPYLFRAEQINSEVGIFILKNLQIAGSATKRVYFVLEAYIILLLQLVSSKDVRKACRNVCDPNKTQYTKRFLYNICGKSNSYIYNRV